MTPMPYICNPGTASSGRSVARLSRLVWDQEVASSNLAAPTYKQIRLNQMLVKLNVYGHFCFWVNQTNAKKVNVLVSYSVNNTRHRI